MGLHSCIRCGSGEAVNGKIPIRIFYDLFLKEVQVQGLALIPIGMLKDLLLKASYRTRKFMGLHSCIRCESGEAVNGRGAGSNLEVGGEGTTPARSSATSESGGHVAARALPCPTVPAPLVNGKIPIGIL
jgi:hypothetical protein